MGNTYIAAIGQPVLIALQINPRDDTLHPRALVYDSSDALVATVDLVLVADGLYQEQWPVPTAEQFSVKFEIYSDALFANDITDLYEVPTDNIIGDLAALQPEAIKPHSLNPARLP